MSLIFPFGLIVCSALWLKGLKSLWQRALLLVAFLALLAVLLPSINQDKTLVYLAIYQDEAKAFTASIAERIERGDVEGAKRRLQYFSKNQEWSMANDPDALRAFYKGIEQAGESAAVSAPRAQPSGPK